MVKRRFTTLDVISISKELHELCAGMRVANIYDVNSKTYLFKLSRGEKKVVLLVESGIRIHSTNYNWPKPPAPDWFAVKLRKHIRTECLQSITQLGIDRVVDLKFGHAHKVTHVIVELYAKGNIILTDDQYVILAILRTRILSTKVSETPNQDENFDVKICVGEVYPFETVKVNFDIITEESVQSLFNSDEVIQKSLKNFLSSRFEYGPSLIEHSLLMKTCLSPQKSVSSICSSRDYKNILDALNFAREVIYNTSFKGFIIQKKEGRTDVEGRTSIFFVNEEYHPLLFKQHETLPYKEFDTFNLAVDEFYSNLEAQRIDIIALQHEKQALKKLENLRIDHEKRLSGLASEQLNDIRCAQLIEANLELVDRAIAAVLELLASQFSWDQIHDMLEDAKSKGDDLAEVVHSLNLENNAIVLLLSDSLNSENAENLFKPEKFKVEVSLEQNAYRNARAYYNKKKNAQKKYEKTMNTSEKAFKSVEKATKRELKEVEKHVTIRKQRKVFWFEKFLWFITSENYLVIAGNNAQQNEIIVKKYMKKGDIYVHADIHGAATCIIKNNSSHMEIPAKSINEAGTFSICHSSAWEAKIVIGAYYVKPEQVSKTAPTGEYLPTGSFMIRGRKNFLPPSQLIMGFGFLFRLDETSVANHANERKSLQYTDNDDSKEYAFTIKDYEERSHRKQKNTNEKNNQSDAKELECDTFLSSSESHEEDDTIFPDTKVVTVGFGLYGPPDSVAKSDEVVSNANENVRAKRYMSAKERKDLRKSSCKSQNRENNINTNNNENNNKLEVVRPYVRGKNKKLKKIKEKYRDQDEEDKRRALAALKPDGARKIKKKSANKKAGQKNSDKISALERQSEAGKRTFLKLVGETTSNLPATEMLPEIQKTREEILQTRQERKQKQKKDEEELEILKKEENIVDEEEKANLDALDQLTGIPRTNDVLLFALPFCAPYSVMLNFKYKVKLTPGNSRKGAAAKLAKELFLKNSDSAVEKDFIKAVTDNELVQQIPGKVKVSAAQISNPSLKKQLKQNKKVEILL